MTLAEDFLTMEPMDHSYHPVPDSAVAHRLLIAKLFATVMPLIRYELTDTIILDDGENPDATGFRRVAEMKGVRPT